MTPADSATLTGQTIICLAPDPWEGLWRNRHQIMTRLARRNTVLYVEPRLYLWEALDRVRRGQLTLADLRRPLAAPYLPPSSQEGGTGRGLWIYHDPYYAPVSGRRTGGPLTAALRRRALLRTLAGLGVTQPPILWLVRPYFADVIGQYGEKLVVYHITDEYSGYANVDDPAAVRRQEEALLRRADLVIVTAPALLERKRPFNPHTYLAPNAVDYEGFQRGMAAGRAHPALAAMPRPRIGYSGALNEKVDFDLLAHVAASRPDWQLVLVGQLDLAAQPRKADALRALPNIHWLGRLPISDLPATIAGFDVCVLPYERNDWTANIDSLKLYEYLAVGAPVVSSDVPAARTFAGPADSTPLVRIAASPADFVAEIAAALAEVDAAAVERRRALAAANTWEHRVSRIESLLSEALDRKQHERDHEHRV
jgi:UDP-galactopyranose mutase